MSAETVLDSWFGGPGPGQKSKERMKNPREWLKDLPPVSLQGRRDYGTSLELGNKRGTKIELKYPSWGLYPRHELQEFLTMLRIDFISQAAAALEQKRTIDPKLQMTEAEKQRGMSREKAFQEFMSRKNA